LNLNIIYGVKIFGRNSSNNSGRNNLPVSGLWVLGTRCWMLDAGYWMLDARIFMAPAQGTLLQPSTRFFLRYALCAMRFAFKSTFRNPNSEF
jgi:hypothetical protein